ncbi:MAG: hypothetical protein MN733_40040, partial [Nitrososphaera sp.]|nr:hypothetical protein [Nitrososphaera sp.]
MGRHRSGMTLIDNLATAQDHDLIAQFKTAMPIMGTHDDGTLFSTELPQKFLETTRGMMVET